MSSSQTFVIVGASLAGAKAAETLRQEGFAGRVVLVGEETERPYERPPLSKDYLRGEEKAKVPYVHEESYYADNDIELLNGTRATALDAGAHEVELEGGERIGFDRLLLATGMTPRPITVPGAQLPGVRYLRRLDDSDGLREAIKAASRLVVIGAGWIGSEAAASARQLGCDVTIVAPEAVPLERVMGQEVGAVYRDLHREHGVDLRLATGVDAILGTRAAEGVRVSDGDTVEADLVLVGIGAAPRVELAESAGLAIDNGVVVDEFLQTSAPDIYAAGDIANAWNPLLGSRIRVEHWANANNQGPAAARNMLGEHAAYSKLPYFFSDQYDLGMEYNGHAASWDQVVLRGDPAAREFLAFWLDGGRVVAGMNANIWDQGDGIKALVKARTTVDRAALADPAVPLESLAG